MKTLLIACTLVFIFPKAHSQTIVDSLKNKAHLNNINVNDHIYNEVYKNIAAYNIRYASYFFNGVNFKAKFRSSTDFFYHWFIPDYGYKLDMYISQLDSSYPDSKFQLYRIYIKGFNYISDNHSLPSISSLGPKTTHDFLIALNKDNGDIKFVSGQFFRSCISEDFHIDREDPTTFFAYLKLRAFDVGGTNIKFEKKTHKKWIFKGYSEIYKKPFIITVDKKDIDITQTAVEALPKN